MNRETVCQEIGEAILTGDYLKCIQWLGGELVARLEVDTVEEIDSIDEEAEAETNATLSGELRECADKVLAKIDETKSYYSWKDLASMAETSKYEVQKLLDGCSNSKLYADGHNITKFEGATVAEFLRSKL